MSCYGILFNRDAPKGLGCEREPAQWAELASAWRWIIAAPEPAKARALAALQERSAVDYEHVNGRIRRALGSKDKVNEVRMARELADVFRRNYARAEKIAREKLTPSQTE